MEQRTHFETIAAGIILLLLTGGSIYLVLPFLPAVLWATIFAVSSWPLFTRINARVGGRNGVAAGLVTLLFILLFLVPLAFVGAGIAEEAVGVVNSVRTLLQSGPPALPAWVGRIPWLGEQFTARWTELVTHRLDLQTMVEPYLRGFASLVLSIGASIGKNLLLLLLSLMLLFFFLKGGAQIALRLEQMAFRLGGDKGKQLLVLAGNTTSSVVYGTLGAAIGQGVLAAIGFWLVGVPAAMLLAFAVFVMGIIPAGLTALVMLPVAVWLFINGRIGWGIFMVVWTLIVSNADNYIRPMFISRGSNLPFVVIFLGVLGGVATGGFLGLFVGSTVLALFYTILLDWSVKQGQEELTEELEGGE